jgi:hypothetical protein
MALFCPPGLPQFFLPLPECLGIPGKYDPSFLCHALEGNP